MGILVSLFRNAHFHANSASSNNNTNNPERLPSNSSKRPMQTKHLHEEDQECGICWEMLTGSAGITFDPSLKRKPKCTKMPPEQACITACGHIFHGQCMGAWIHRCNNLTHKFTGNAVGTCPKCRKVVKLRKLEPIIIIMDKSEDGLPGTGEVTIKDQSVADAGFTKIDRITCDMDA